MIVLQEELFLAELKVVLACLALKVWQGWPVSGFTTITVSLIIDDSFIWQQNSNQFVHLKSLGHVWCVHNYLKTK